MEGHTAPAGTAGGPQRRWWARKDYLFLAILIIALFWARMDLATETDSLSYNSYLTVRQVEHIHDTGMPLRDDPLSVTGNVRVTNPFFNYLLAVFTLITPLFYKIIPNLFMTLMLIPVYLITYRITSSRAAAFVSVIIAGTGPIAFSSYIVTPSAVPLAIFIFLCIIALLHDTQAYLTWIVILSVLLAFTHPLIFVVVLALLSIIILLKIEGYGVDNRLGELFFFTLILATWFYVIIYKRALFTHGIATIWQNAPSSYLSLSFADVSMLSFLYGLGVVTFLFGVFGAYHALFENRERSSYTIIGSIFAIGIALIAKMLPLTLGLLLLTPLLAILAGYGMLIGYRYMRRMKTPWIVYPAAAVLCVFFLFSAILPALTNARESVSDTPSAASIAMMHEIDTVLQDDAIILTTIHEAAAVQYYSGHKTLTDSDFLHITNSDEIVEDVNSVYTARFRTAIINQVEKHGFDVILFSDVAAQEYGRAEILIDDLGCITKEQLGGAILYRVRCEVRE